MLSQTLQTIISSYLSVSDNGGGNEEMAQLDREANEIDWDFDLDGGDMEEET